MKDMSNVHPRQPRIFGLEVLELFNRVDRDPADRSQSGRGEGKPVVGVRRIRLMAGRPLYGGMVTEMRLDLTFAARGMGGAIHVAIKPNRDPLATGHDKVAPNFDEEAFRGFPLCTAEVAFPGEGPAGWFSWIQWIRHEREGQVIGEWLDTPPWLEGPFYAVGCKPTLADAPSKPDHLGISWIATSFLVITRESEHAPGVQVLESLAGFTWGYRRGDGSSTDLLSPQPAGYEQFAELGRLLDADQRWRVASAPCDAVGGPCRES